MSDLLDRDIRPATEAYDVFVSNADQFDLEVRQWYRDSHEGRDPALSDVHHGYWRVIEERNWWITPRKALQDAWPLPVEPLPPGSTEKLRVRGQFFEKENGERFTAKQTTSFRLYERFLGNEDVRPVLGQVQSVGFNMVRVLSTCDYMFRLYPQEHSDYYERLPEFANLLSQYGLYIEFTVFADATRVFPNDVRSQQTHWNQIIDVLRDSPNVILELVNENDQTINYLDPNAFPRPTGLLASHGSNGSQAQPIQPFWDYATFHTNSASEEQRKVGHNAWEIWGGPTLTNETSRYWEVGMWVWGAADLERQKLLAYDSAAGAALLCAGACFHTVNGKQSVLWTPNEETIGREWVRGMDSVPLEFQDGAYIRRDDLNGPGVLRAYERRLSDGRGHVVLIHA